MTKKTDVVNVFKYLLLSLKKIDIYIIKKIFHTSIIFCIYLIFAKPTLILSITYSFIAILFFISHTLLVKNYNLVFSADKFAANQNFLNIPSRENKKIFLCKVIFLQIRIFLISNWLLSNAFLTSKHDVLFDPSYDLLINGWISWVLLISLLFGLGYYKYNLFFSNIRLANCLLPNPKSSYKTTLYNYLLGMETYIRLVSFIILTIVTLVTLFEILSKKLGLNSFLSQPLISSLTIFVVFMYCRVKIEKLIDYLSKKLSMSFISVFAIALLVILAIIFIMNQLILSQTDILHMLHLNVDGLPNNILDTFVFNQDTLKILFIGLNVVLVFGAASDIFLKQIINQKVHIIYYASVIFPLLYSLLRCNINFNLAMQGLLTNETINCLMILLILSVFRFNYQDIYHILCMFGIKVNEKDCGKVRKIKVDFSFVIKSTLMVSMVFFSGYYLFSWILIEYIVAIGSMLILPIIIVLLASVLFNKNCLTKSNKSPIFDERI